MIISVRRTRLSVACLYKITVLFMFRRVTHYAIDEATRETQLDCHSQI